MTKDSWIRKAEIKVSTDGENDIEMLHNSSTNLYLNHSSENWPIDYLARLDYKVAFGLIVSSIILLNGIVILTLIFSRSLRDSPYNCILMSLSLTDFLVGCSIRPMISMQGSDNFYGCMVAFSFYITVIAASNFHLLLISIVRLYAFCQETLMVRHIGRKAAMLVVSITWLLAVVINVNENVFWLHVNDTVLVYGCNFKSLYKNYTTYVTRFHSLLHLVILFFMGVCNFVLSCKLYKHSNTKVMPLNVMNDNENSLNTNTSVEKTEEERVHRTSITNGSAQLYLVDTTFGTSDEGHHQNTGVTKQTEIDKDNGFTSDDNYDLNQESFSTNSLNCVLDESPTNIPSGTTEQKTVIGSSKEGQRRNMGVSENPNKSKKRGTATQTEIDNDTGFTSNENYDLTRQSSTNSINCMSDESRTNIPSGTTEQRTPSHHVRNPEVKARARFIRAITTLMIIVMIHILFNGPFYMFLLIRGLVAKQDFQSNTETLLLAVASLNSIVNPIVYICSIQEFRLILRRFINKCRFYCLR